MKLVKMLEMAEILVYIEAELNQLRLSLPAKQ